MAKGEWNPTKKYRVLVSQIQDVLSNGEKRTVRDVYYALEARGHDWEYRFVKKAVRDGRRAGYIDPAQIVDTSRPPVNTTSNGWDHPRSYLDERVDGIWNEYWENFWTYHDQYVEVWLEKASLAPVFEPICQEHRVRLEATRGDWSDSKAYEAAQRLIKAINGGKDITILYFGDFNPSGYHAPVSILDRLEYYGFTFRRDFPGVEEREYFDPEVGFPAHFPSECEDRDRVRFNFKRCGINLEHIRAFNLPENPVPSASDKDSTIKEYFQKYVSEGKDTNVELNALKEYERDYLEELINESITEHVNDDRREQVAERERQAREILNETITIDHSPLEGFDPPIRREGEGER